MALDVPSGGKTPPVKPPPPGRPVRFHLPSHAILLTWLFYGRLAMAVGALWGATLAWIERPELAFIVSVVVLVEFVITAYGFWVVEVRRAPPSEPQLHAQAIADCVLITTIVHLTGGADSAFPALYVLVLAAYAILLPFASAALITMLASILYFADAYWGGHAAQPGLPFFGQVAVFLVVFLVVAPMAARLRQAGADQATLQSELLRARLEADEILRNIRSGVFTVDGLGRLAFINPMAERLLRLDGEALLGLPILDRVKVLSPELWSSLVSALRHGRRISRAEGTVLLPDGRSYPIGLSITTLDRKADELPSVTAIFNDISDQKRLHELHLRAERLEAVAELSASLAHEIRNPLASIRSSVEQLARSPRANDDERFLAQLIVRESDRLSRLLSEFLDFSRVRIGRFVPVDLYQVAQDAARLVREHPDCGDGVSITVGGGPTMLDGDEDLLHRVVANLLLNAIQASPGQARITVVTGKADPAELPVGSGIEQPIRLEVRDEGPGIPEELRDRLFEPFVTGRAGGSGLGLAIVQRAVEAHRGLALVDSVPGKGTTFTIYLPARFNAEEAA